MPVCGDSKRITGFTIFVTLLIHWSDNWRRTLGFEQGCQLLNEEQRITSHERNQHPACWLVPVKFHFLALRGHSFGQTSDCALLHICSLTSKTTSLHNGLLHLTVTIIS